MKPTPRRGDARRCRRPSAPPATSQDVVPAQVSTAHNTNLNALLLEDHRGHRLRADGGGHSGVPAQLLRHLRHSLPINKDKFKKDFDPKVVLNVDPVRLLYYTKKNLRIIDFFKTDRQGSQLHVVEGRDPKGHGGERGGRRCYVSKWRSEKSRGERGGSHCNVK